MGMDLRLAGVEAPQNGALDSSNPLLKVRDESYICQATVFFTCHIPFRLVLPAFKIG